MADAPDIAVRFRADGADAVANAVKQLANELKDLKQRQVEAAESSLTLGKAIEGIVGIETIRRLVNFGKEVFNGVVQVGRLSQETGVSARVLSTLAAAGDNVGVSQEQIGTAILRLSRNIVELQGGSTKAATAFDRLGLSAKDFTGLNADQKVLKVFDAIGKLGAGSTKAAEAQALFSRGGAALIPLLNQLHAEGFDKLADDAARLGKLLDDETVASFMATAGAMKEVQDKAEGMMQQFETGLMPALADAADELVQETANGEDGFEKLGEMAGNAIRFIIVGMKELAMDIALVINTIESDFAHLWEVVRTGGSAVFKAFADAATGNFKQAWSELASGWDTVKTLSRDAENEENRLWDENVAEKKKLEDRMFDPAQQKARQKERAGKFLSSLGGQGEDVGVADKTGQTARLDGLRQALEQELKAYKDETKLELAEEKNRYEQGLISQAEYFAARRTAIEQDLAAEITTLQSERGLYANAPAKNDKERQENQQKVLVIDQRIHDARVQAALQEKQLDGEDFAAKEKNAKTILDYQQQILLAQGRTFDAAILGIAQESSEIRRALVQAGLDPSSIDATVSALDRAKATAAKLDQFKTLGSQALDEFDLERQAIENDQTRGLLTQYEAEQKILELERERIGGLRELADAQLEEAQATGDKAKILEAERFEMQIDTLSASIEGANANWTKFKVNVREGVTNDLTQFLGSGINQVDNLADAFKQLGVSALQTLQRIAAQMLVQMAVSKVFDWIRSKFGGGGSGSGGADQVATAAAAGIAQAAPLMVASGMLGASGAALEIGGATILAAASELMAAAMMLQTVNAFSGLGGLGLAGGGLVSGPGTWTSDSIPARLSDGEFVVRAAAVRAVGVDTLAAINRGLRIPAIVAGAIPRFADGGLVRADTAAGSGELRLKIGLERGLILQELESKDAGRLIVQHSQMNAKAMKKAIERG